MSSDSGPSDSNSFKVAFIGAGSIGFTRKLVGDILTVPEFGAIDIAFMDISQQNLSMVERLVRRDIEANGRDGVRLTGTPGPAGGGERGALRVLHRAHRRTAGSSRPTSRCRCATASTSAWATPCALAASCTASAASR